MSNTQINEYLEKILSDNKVNYLDKKKMFEIYRAKVESSLADAYDVKPNFRYGGSLSKGTANINECDIDLLCYLDHTSSLTVKEIFERTVNKLSKEYYVVVKNSAINIVSKNNSEKWDFKIDVVPGKYRENDSDVDLWCSKQNKNLKTNPEKQIQLILK